MNSRPFSSRKTPLLLIVSGLLLSLLVLWVLLTVGRWKGHPPRLSFDRNFKSSGKNLALVLTIEDEKTCLRKISVELQLNDQAISLVNEHYSEPPLVLLQGHGKQISKIFNLGHLITETYLIREGPARLEISASDQSFRRFFAGNETVLHRELTFDIHPPQLEALSRQHYIHQGEPSVFSIKSRRTLYVRGFEWVQTSFLGIQLIQLRKNFIFQFLRTLTI